MTTGHHNDQLIDQRALASLKKTDYNGFFIVLEGIDGSGKTTSSRSLSSMLQQRGYKVFLTREPTSDSAAGQKLRNTFSSDVRLTPQEELALFMEDRKDHLSSVIEPKLNEGYIVICDRYFYSNAAYQGALGLNWSEIVSQNLAFSIVPDAVFFFNLPVKVALQRINTRHNHKAKTSFEGTKYLIEVDRIYHLMLSSLVNPPISSILADQSTHSRSEHMVTQLLSKLHAKTNLLRCKKELSPRN
ncbi:MAG: dTMP kinase [Candidatus Kariarchaeaceae archaeon]